MDILIITTYYLVCMSYPTGKSKKKICIFSCNFY